MRVTRKRPDPFGQARIESWLAAGAELRVDADRERAYVRGRTVAFIITWPEASEILASGLTLRPGRPAGRFDGYRARRSA